MRQSYHSSVILLSFGIAFLGSYIAITACEQYRLCRIGIVQSQYIPPFAYLIVMALCLGGVGIWCMHFVGMSAVNMHADGERMDVRYDTGLTLLSLILVIVLTMLGFYVSSFDKVFMKTKREIIEMFVEDARKMSMKKIKNITVLQTIGIIGTRAPQHLLAGGFLTGSGVVVMHYVGMAAMQFEGKIVWNAGIIAASAIIAFAASTAAFWILFRLLSIYPNKENLRIACAFTMAVAVCGMHYVGMSAATFEHVPGLQLPTSHHSITDTEAFHAGMVTAALVALLAGMIALADLRNSVLMLSTELYRADRVIMNVPTTPHSTCAVTIQRYVAQRRHGKFSLGVLNETVSLDHDGDHEHADDSSTGSIAHDDTESCCGRLLHQLRDRRHSFDAMTAMSSSHAHVHPASSYEYLDQPSPVGSFIKYKPDLAMLTGTSTPTNTIDGAARGPDGGSPHSIVAGTSSALPGANSNNNVIHHRSPRMGAASNASTSRDPGDRAKIPEVLVSIHSLA